MLFVLCGFSGISFMHMDPWVFIRPVSWRMVVRGLIVMRCLVQLLNRPPYAYLLALQCLETGMFKSWMWRMFFFTVICLRLFICFSFLGLLILTNPIMFVIYSVLYMGLSKPHMLGSNGLGVMPLSSVFSIVKPTPPYLYFTVVRILLIFCFKWMILLFQHLLMPSCIRLFSRYMVSLQWHASAISIFFLAFSLLWILQVCSYHRLGMLRKFLSMHTCISVTLERLQ